MVKNNSNSQSFWIKKISFIVFMIIAAFCVNYDFNRNLIDANKIVESQYVIEGNSYFDKILTGGKLPSIITEDTYLTKGTYTAGNLLIQEGVTLEVEAGTTIIFGENIKITLNGTLKLNGIEAENINLNIYQDKVNGESVIFVESTGILESTYTNIINNLRTIRGTYAFSAVNNKGRTKLRHTKITSEILCDISNSGNLEITNSELPNDIIIYKYVGDLIIKDNIVKRDIIIPLSVSDINTFQNVKDNYDSNNQLKIITLTGSPTTDVKLYKQSYKHSGDLTIPINTTMEVEAGTNIAFGENIKITANGTLKLNGTESENVNLNIYQDKVNGETVIFVESTGILESTYTNVINNLKTIRTMPFYVVGNKGMSKLSYMKVTSVIPCNISNSGNLEITNSELPNDIIVNKYNGHLIIKDNVVAGDIKVSLSGSDNNIFKDITNNSDLNQKLKAITLTDSPVGDVRLYNQNYMIPYSFVIPINSTFEVDAGTNITMGNDSKIVVNGILRLNGTEAENVNLNTHHDETDVPVFIIVESTGTFISNYTNIKNSSSRSITYKFSVISNKGITNLNHTKISSKLIYNISNSGNLEILNSELPNDIIVNKYSGDLIIKDNIVTGDIKVPLSISDINTFKNVINNFDTKQQSKAITLTDSPVGDVRLYNQNYIIPNSLLIPINSIFEVDAGTNVTMGNDAKIVINGILRLNGTEAENVNLNVYHNDVYTPIFINIDSTGTMDSTYTNINNTSPKTTEFKFQVINNNGNAKLNYTKISSKLIYNISNNGNLEIINSELPNDIIVNKYSDDLIIKNNIIRGTIKTPLSICNTTIFKTIKDNYNQENEQIKITLTGNPVTNVKLYKQSYIFSDSPIIPVDSVFEVEAGTKLYFNSYNKVTINGILNLSGSLTDSIVMTNSTGTTGVYWEGIRIGTTGVMMASNTEIRQAGSSSYYPIENQGQLIMWNSVIANGYSSKAIRFNTTNPDQILTNNSILGSVTSNIQVQAYYNYWGHVSGPRRRNPETGSYFGSGFAVGDNVIVEPFHTSFVKIDVENLELIRINELRHFGEVGINSSSGNYSKKFVDLNTSDQNTNLNFERTYNSRNSESSILGSGWTFSFSSKVKENPYNPNSYIVYLPDGSVNIFDKQSDNTYTGINSRNSFEITNEKYILTKLDQTIYTYNTNGILESITDKYGNTTKIIMNMSGNITSVIDSANRKYLLEYSNNLLTKITDPIGRIVTYTYNANNLLETVTNVDGVITNYTYDSNNRLISIKENNIVTETIEYQSAGTFGGRVSKYTNSFGNQITYSYDQTNSITTETDSNGYITKKYYDREGYVFKVINPDNTQILTTYNNVEGVNKYGEELTQTNIYTQKIIYARDSLGRITKVTNPDSSNKQYTYNSKNNIITEIDELGNLTQYIYANDSVTLLKIVKPIDGFTLYDDNSNSNLFEITSYTYYNSDDTNNIKGLLKTKTDAKGKTTYEYDQFGNISKVIDGTGNETKYSNNKLGWKLTEQKNDGYITTYQYNHSGNLTKLTKDSNIISLTEYNYQNKPSKTTDGNSNFTLTEYDKVGNITKSIDKEGNITIYSYDLYGNVIKQINPNNSIYIYEYDKLNRLTKKYFKENESSTPILLEEKTYTNTSNYTITTKTYTTNTEFKTKVETYNYQNKLISEKNETITKTNTYLKNGLLSYEVDGNSGYTYYFYTKTNHLEKKYVMTGTSQYIYTAYVYDNFGRLIEEKIGKTKVSSTTAMPTTFISTYYKYNDIGQVVKKTTSSGEEINYTYDAFGNIVSEITKIDNDNYQTKEYQYNYLNKLTEEKNRDIILQYNYDKVGNLIKKTTGENKVTEYTYNKNSKITKTTVDGSIQEQLYYDSMNNIIKKTDGNGNVSNNYYDKQNNLIQEENPKLLSTFNAYDLSGRLIESKNPNNTITTYTYDKFDNVIQKKIQDKIIYKYEYDKNNNLTKETDPLGYTTLYAYDKTNKLTQKTDKLGYTIQYQYDTLFNITSEKNKKNQYTYYAYDERNNKISTTINNVIVEQNEYDLLDNITKTTDGNANITTYYYNDLNELIKKVNPLGYIQEYEYNNDNELIKITDNLEKQTIYSYDSNGNIIGEFIQRSDGTEKISISKKYDNNNNLIKEIDGNGNITNYQYDSLNNRIKTINPLNQITTYVYDNTNNLISETNYLGDSKTYSYDEFDRLIGTKNELDRTVEVLEYDLNGRKIKSTDALGNSTTYVYDKNDNITETIDQLGYSEKVTYDQLDNVLTKTDKNGNITKYEYDTNQNLTKVTNPLSEVTNYQYDKNNNLIKVTDARGKITEYTYDSLNNELTEKDGLGNIEYKEYYMNGLLKNKKTRNSNKINYTYDIHNRLINENDIIYSYDNNDNLIETLDSNSQTTREYDSLDRVISKTENGLTSTFIYDIDGYKEKTIDPLQNITVKEYDKVRRLIKVNNDVEYVYNVDGTLQKLTYATGATEEYFYNSDKTLNKLVNKHGDTTEEYTYVYDKNKNIIKEVNPTQMIISTYDSLNRLKTVSINDEVTTYTYDKSGNRLKEVTGTISKDYIYDSKNLLSQVTEKNNNVVSKITMYGYDLSGNLLTTNVNGIIVETNVFNEKNELVSTDKHNSTTTYNYNVEGNRISKGNGNGTTKFIYEGTKVILELDQNNNELARNLHGLALVSRKTDNNGYYFYNGHGDTVTIVDEDNEVLNEYTYDVWGNILTETETMDNPYRYAGYYYDTETGNYYLLSRYYNPEIARFISEDTYRGELNDPLSLNRYVYVVNNPLIYTDPDGYFAKEIGQFLKGLWDETKNVAVTGTAIIHGGFVAVGDATIGLGQFALDTGVSTYTGISLLSNELYYNLGMLNETAYLQNKLDFGGILQESLGRLSIVNMAKGIEQNLKTTINLDNISKFLDKDTNYLDKVSYATDATKSAAIIYGAGKTGYNLGKGIYQMTHTTQSIMSQVNITNINTNKFENLNGNMSLNRISPYDGNNVINSIKIAGIGSTAKTIPSNLKEQLAMEQVKSNPLQNSNTIIKNLKDKRWNGWEKRAVNVNGVEIHYNYNPKTNLFDDFKIGNKK